MDVLRQGIQIIGDTGYKFSVFHKTWFKETPKSFASGRN